MAQLRVLCLGLSVLMGGCVSLAHEHGDAGDEAAAAEGPKPSSSGPDFEQAPDDNRDAQAGTDAGTQDNTEDGTEDAAVPAHAVDASAAHDAGGDAPDASVAMDAALALDAATDASMEDMLDAGTDASLEDTLDAGTDASAIGLDASVGPGESCDVGSFLTPTGCEAFPTSTLDADRARCRIRPDHTLWCWGLPASNSTWQEPKLEAQVGDDADWISVSVGPQQICGIRAPGTLWCLGTLNLTNVPLYQNTPLQIGTDSDWLQVSAGSASCGIKQDGSLWCWGVMWPLNPGVSSWSAVPVRVGSDSDWSFVASINTYACAIRTNGTLECFGDNHYGRLGDGTELSRGTPAPIAVPGPWRSVAVGSVPCAVRYDGTLWCWGNYTCSECTTEDLVPHRVGTGSDWTSIVASSTVGPCGLRGAGQLLCRDQQHSGAPFEPAPIDTELGYTQVAPGCAEHQDGTVRCWGYPLVGTGIGNIEPDPVRVGTRSDWKDVEMSNFTIATYTDGSVEIRSPHAPEEGSWIETEVYLSSACAIRDDHTLWCSNLEGASNWTWKQQSTFTDVLHVIMGHGNKLWACAIREGSIPGQGSLWCAQPGFDPAWRQAGSDTDWVTLSRGPRPCGIHADGTLTCWDVKTVAGGPLFTWTALFTDIGTDHDWSMVSASDTKCAIKTDGSLWCWDGMNQWGQIGNGTRTPVTQPTHIAPGTHWKDIIATYLYTCGVQTDGSLWCWGLGTFGQLGVGTPGVQRLVPTRVGTDADWEVVRGAQATCGIRSGELWCWGDNSSGFVTGESRYEPTPQIIVEGESGAAKYCPVPRDDDMDGYAGCLGDCNDTNPDVNPFMPEACNGMDDNCDGALDEGCP